MESWAKSGFPLFKYPELVKTILLNSFKYNEDIFEMSIIVILESIKSASFTKVDTLTEIEPTDQLKSFSSNEIQSVKLIIEYILAKK